MLFVVRSPGSPYPRPVGEYPVGFAFLPSSVSPFSKNLLDWLAPLHNRYMAQVANRDCVPPLVYNPRPGATHFSGICVVVRVSRMTAEEALPVELTINGVLDPLGETALALWLPAGLRPLGY